MNAKQALTRSRVRQGATSLYGMGNGRGPNMTGDSSQSWWSE